MRRVILSLETPLARAVCAALATFALVTALRLTGALERMELAAYDLGMRVRAESPIDARIVLIDETEDDLQRFGHPLSDEVLARIIERALALKARTIGIDKFRDIPVAPGSEVLARILGEHRNVYWSYQFGGSGVRHIAPPRGLASGARAGFVDVLVDPGGIVRRGLLYLDQGGPPQPSFALALALAYLAPEGITARPDPANPANLRLGAATITAFESNDGGYAGADAAGYQILLDYRGMPARFARVSLGKFLDGAVDPEVLRDRIVIFGSSAESLKDFFHTPFPAAAEPATGMELHAHLASQLLRLAKGESKPVRALPEGLEYALLALCCALGMGAWSVSRAWFLGAFAAAGLALLAGAWLALAHADLWFPVVPLALGFALSASVAAGLRSIHEAQERASLMALFSKHVSPEFAREIWAHRAELLEGNTLRPLQLRATVLFADLHGYSTVAERLSPAQTVAWLNEFMAPMADIIMGRGGVIRQYAGDAIMAVFGAPRPRTARGQQEHDARAALACAVDMVRAFGPISEKWKRSGLPAAGLHIGIQSGPMVACSVGSADRQEFTVIGDVVNVAARLQSLEMPGIDTEQASRILLGEETFQLLAERGPCELLGKFPVKGRSEPVTTYRVRPQGGPAAGA